MRIKNGVCSGFDAIFSCRDFNFQRWFFIPGSIPWMLRRNVEEIVRACELSTFPVEVGRGLVAAFAEQDIPSGGTELVDTLAGWVAEPWLSTGLQVGDTPVGVDGRSSLTGVMSVSVQTFPL